MELLSNKILLAIFQSRTIEQLLVLKTVPHLEMGSKITAKLLFREISSFCLFEVGEKGVGRVKECALGRLHSSTAFNS